MDHDDLLKTLNCPLCGRPGGTRAHVVRETLSYRNLPDGMIFTVTECPNCGLKYVNPRLREEIVETIYTEDLYASYGKDRSYIPKVSLRHDIFHDNLNQRLASYAHFCSVLERLGASGSALEIGFSFGYLLDMLRTHGFEVSGVELSRYTYDFARRTFGFTDIRCGDFLDIDFGDRRFDLIVLWHVFEHIYRPNETLSRCGELLSDGGLLMITCPFHDAFKDRHINPVEHLYYLQKEHVRRFMEKAFPCETFVENPFVFGRKRGVC